MTVNELIERLQKMPPNAEVDIQTETKRGGPAGQIIFFDVDGIKPYGRSPDVNSRICIGLTETNRFK